MSSHTAIAHSEVADTASLRTLAYAALAPLVGVASAIWAEFSSRRDRQILSAMNDLELSDIGLCRGQVFSAARFGRATS